MFGRSQLWGMPANALIWGRELPTLTFHGSFSKKPPHEMDPELSKLYPFNKYRSDPNVVAHVFHTGTRRAAMDRLSHLNDPFGFYDDRGYANKPGAYIHAYEITKKAPIGRFVGDGERYETDRATKIWPYVNTVEGGVGEHAFQRKGGISYYMPRHFIKQGKVNYLGSQFIPKKDIPEAD